MVGILIWSEGQSGGKDKKDTEDREEKTRRTSRTGTRRAGRKSGLDSELVGGSKGSKRQGDKEEKKRRKRQGGQGQGGQGGKVVGIPSWSAGLPLGPVLSNEPQYQHQVVGNDYSFPL